MTSRRFYDKLIIMAIADTYTIDMPLAAMLDELPAVFDIEDIVSAFAVPEREAILIADRMEQENETVIGGEGRWIRLFSPEYFDTHFLGYHKLSAASSLERLEAFYGDYLRRIEGLRALEYSGVTLSSTLSAASSKKADEKYVLEKFKILHKWEDTETLVLHSDQIDERTWKSSIERCLLELADEISGPTIMEYLMVGIEDTSYSADKMLSAALDLGYETALRKIGSIIKWIPDNAYLPDSSHEIAEIAAGLPGEWSEISSVVGENKATVIEDDDFRIIWRVLPEDIYDNTLT